MAVYLDGYQDLKLGLVKSAYANGKQNMGCTGTGGFSPQSKFLHHKVSEFDVGMFRSETVVLSEKAIGSIMEAGTNAK